MNFVNIIKSLILVVVLSELTGCGTIHAMRNLEEGSGGTFMEMDKLVESKATCRGHNPR
jgi:hypothetical protein